MGRGSSNRAPVGRPRERRNGGISGIGVLKPMSVAATLSLLASSLLATVGLRGRTRFYAAPCPSGRRLYTRHAAGGDRFGRCAPAAPAQQFVMGRDIPGEWWKVFHSKELDALIGQALQANPSLQAAQAALWQAKENLYAQAASCCRASTPTPRSRASNSRRRNSARRRSVDSSISTRRPVNVSYAPDVFGGQRRQIEATAAAAEYQRFELEATYLTLTANVVTAAVQEASLRGQIEATRDNHQGRDRSARRRAQSVRGRRRQPRRRADAAIGVGDHAGDACRRCRSSSSSSATCCSR